MNIHQYTPDADEQSALTKFLGNDSWKQLSRHNPREFFRGVLELYKKRLDKLCFSFVGREVFITNDNNTPLYLLLYASKHPKGKEFWDKAMKGVLPMELDLGKSLGNIGVANRMAKPKEHLRWLRKRWGRISEWPE